MPAALKGPLYAAGLLALALPLQAATLDGMKIHSTSKGKGSKTIVLVHGWTCDETSWAANVPELSKHYRVITLDRLDHPGPEKRGDLPSLFDGGELLEWSAELVVWHRECSFYSL